MTPEQSMEERFDANVNELPNLIEEVPAWFKAHPNTLYGENIYPETILELSHEKLKAFITAEVQKAEVRGIDKGMDYMIRGGFQMQLKQAAVQERQRIVAIVEGMKPILWNDDIEKHSRNMDKYNLLDFLIRSIQEPKE